MPKRQGASKPKAPKEAPPHTIEERRAEQGYRRMGKINLAECESGGSPDLADYEKWLKEIPILKNK